LHPLRPKHFQSEAALYYDAIAKMFQTNS